MRAGSINTVDLFAGCGGISNGLLRVDGNPYKILFANEWNHQAASTYKLNHPDTHVSEEDVKNLTGATILQDAGLKRGETDLIVGGPPCQGFSMAGNRFIDDPRNQYFKEFVRIVDEMRPDVVIMENVPQFITLWNGLFGKEVVKTFNKRNYNTEINILLASDYGVPQIRRRVIFISVRNDFHKEKITFPKPTHERIVNALELEKGIVKPKNSRSGKSKLNRFVSVEEAIGDLPPLSPKNPRAESYTMNPFSDYQKQRRKNSSKVHNHELWNHRNELIEYISQIPEGGRMIENIPRDKWKGGGFSQAYARLHRKGIAYTITTFIHNPGSGRFIHYRDLRAISIREAARLQSFDDDFIFLGKKTEQEMQVGNAVPPLMSEKIGEHVHNAIFRKREIVGMQGILNY